MNLMIRKCYIKILLNLNPPGIRRINYIQGVRGGMCQTSGGGGVFLMLKYTDITQNT